MHVATITGLALGIVSLADGHSIVPRGKNGPSSFEFFWKNIWNMTLLRPYCHLMVDMVRKEYKEADVASAWCVHHMDIPVETQTSTATTFTKTIRSTVTVSSGTGLRTGATVTITQDVTSTARDLKTITNTITETNTIEAVSTSSVTSCASPTASVLRREAGSVLKRGAGSVPSNVPKPKSFNLLYKAVALSQACSCLSIPSRMTTKSTLYLSKPTTTTTTVTVSITGKATVTGTVTQAGITKIKKIATKFETITTNTTVFTSTTMVLAVPAFNLYAVGGNHDGNPFQGDSNYVGFVALENEASPAIFEFTTGNDTVLQVLNGPRAGKTGGIDNGPSPPDVRNAVYFGNDPFPNVTCRVTDNSDGTCPLSCQGIRGNTSYGCGVAWRIGSASDVASCGGSAFTPYAVEV